ncbi:MAG TPA: HAD-IB family hydrolase [Solirubrobacteraceae bacterium]|jgi:HAD superfamily hydrolase (TIGR01490 family)|nr:HAD-IB family hydrolase [Solirubrobacteraceae bacterium]
MPTMIADRLAGQTLLVTGASGFLAKAMLSICLDQLRGIRQIRLLLRAADDDAARLRMRDEVLGSTAFAGLEPGLVDAAIADGRVDAFSGDLAREQLGRTDLGPLSGVDTVVHCAASVSFQQPLDEMLELNVIGTIHLVRALAQAGVRPHFVHVSTAYAAGTRTGLVLERPSGRGPAEPDLDPRAELAAARAWRSDLEADSRLPAEQHRFVADARQELGPAGAPAIGARAEDARRTWVYAQLVERGRERSRALGWTDAYGLSKALGERALLEEPLPSLTIVRPSIIESALRSPFPGWIEGLKVADPVILAYASGMISRFPGDRSARLDLVPVDLVANACIAAAARPAESGPLVINVTSGARNPLRIGSLSDQITDYFRERPLPDEDGLPVEVADWKFMSTAKALRAIDRGERGVRAARRVLDHIAVPRVDEVERRLHREQRRLERLRLLAEIYGPYVELDCMFDDRHTRELLASLAPEDQLRFPFDTAAIDWPSYLCDAHLPALRAMVPGRRRLPTRQTEAIADGPPALAIFDIEGVVLDATVAHFYAWLRGRSMAPLDRTLWMAGLTTRIPGYLIADRRSRADFTRGFYQLYKGLPAGALRDQARASLSDFILPRLRHDAVRRIRAHRERGDRVVLVTGALDFLVEPLRHLADDLIAARLIERRGAFTGELAEPPLTGDGRASTAARLAAEAGFELADCHAYGDSISDLPMLELVGHPFAINPDFRLGREAHRRHWPVLDWGTEPGARNRPLARLETSV